MPCASNIVSDFHGAAQKIVVDVYYARCTQKVPKMGEMCPKKKQAVGGHLRTVESTT